MYCNIKILLIFILFPILGNTQDLQREYYFPELEITDSTSLVLIVVDPQTETLKQLGHRIIKDTNVISKIKSTFYIEYEGDKIINMCDYDMFFYSLTGNKAKYLNRLNSDCDVNSLNIFFENGATIRTDSLSEIPEEYKTKPSSIFTKDVFMNTVTNLSYWDQAKTYKYPSFYYDNFFEVEILLDTLFTIEENVELFIKKYTSDLTDINWNYRKNSISLEEKKKQYYFLTKNIPCMLNFTIYFKDDKVALFNEFELKPTVAKLSEQHQLILFYK